MPADAAIVLGGGYKSPTSTKLDHLVRERLRAAIKAVRSGRAENLVITGNLLHETGIMFADRAAEIARRLGVPKEKIYVADSIMQFATTTRGDVEQAVKLARENRWSHMLIFTQKPHWVRTKIFFHFVAPDIKVGGFTSALSAPIWFWAKEIVLCILLILSRGDDKHPIYRSFCVITDKFANLTGMHVPNTDQAKKRHQ